jgi:hypothetical protein
LAVCVSRCYLNVLTTATQRPASLKGFCCTASFLARPTVFPHSERRYSQVRLGHVAESDNAVPSVSSAVPPTTPAAGATSTAGSGRESISERRHSSTAQDLNDYIYSVAEDHDANDDDDVFEMDSGDSNVNQAAGSNCSAAAISASEAKRRTQSLGSLSGEPKSPRKVCIQRPDVNNLKALSGRIALLRSCLDCHSVLGTISVSSWPLWSSWICARPLYFLAYSRIINQYRSGMVVAPVE